MDGEIPFGDGGGGGLLYLCMGAMVMIVFGLAAVALLKGVLGAIFGGSSKSDQPAKSALTIDVRVVNSRAGFRYDKFRERS
jgi:hypothetical protein